MPQQNQTMLGHFAFGIFKVKCPVKIQNGFQGINRYF
jgi:hypothetical protein